MAQKKKTHTTESNFPESVQYLYSTLDFICGVETALLYLQFHFIKRKLKVWGDHHAVFFLNLCQVKSVNAVVMQQPLHLIHGSSFLLYIFSDISKCCSKRTWICLTAGRSKLLVIDAIDVKKKGWTCLLLHSKSALPSWSCWLQAP